MHGGSSASLVHHSGLCASRQRDRVGSPGGARLAGCSEILIFSFPWFPGTWSTRSTRSTRSTAARFSSLRHTTFNTVEEPAAPRPARDEIIISQHLHYKVVHRCAPRPTKRGRKMEQRRGCRVSLGLASATHCVSLHTGGANSVPLTCIRDCAGNSLEMKNAVRAYYPRSDGNQPPPIPRSTVFL